MKELKLHPFFNGCKFKHISQKTPPIATLKNGQNIIDKYFELGKEDLFNGEENLSISSDNLIIQSIRQEKFASIKDIKFTACKNISFKENTNSKYKSKYERSTDTTEYL